jgi:type IV pilus assembly protein PilV
MNTRPAPNGFTLIEVLIALLVLAIGALGASSLILQARRAAQQSSLSSSAVHLAARAADAMRANANAIAAADASNPYLQLDYDALADGPPRPATDCSATACDSAALAEADLAFLRRTMFEHFPLGRIKICRDGAAFDNAAMTLRWQCDGASGVPAIIKIGWRQRVADGGAAAGAAPVIIALPLALRTNGSAP